MQTITASDLKQNSMRLQDALREDLLVTKRDKPFVVIMDYEKYKRLEQYIDDVANDEKIAKLKRLKQHQDLEFCELGVDDGLSLS